MSKAQLVITAVVLEGRSKSEVARDYNVSRYWVQQLVKRYETEGAAAFEPHSRRPHRNPRAVGADLEDKVVRLRKTLDKAGYDAGAATIAEHLTRDPSITKIPAVATIWRILTRRGFVTPQPQKRPRSSWKRFETDLPNQCWQADVTHWRLADTTEVEILNIIDDHSQLAIASRPTRHHRTRRRRHHHRGLHRLGHTGNHADRAHRPTNPARRTGHQVHQLPALPPADLRKSRTLPQTLKKRLTALPPAATIAELQDQINDFRDYYNTSRPHRALHRRSPLQAFTDRPKAFPTGCQIPPHYRVRHHRIDAAGVFTIRYNTRLHHIGLSKHLRGTHVTVLIDNRDIRVLDRDTGTLIRKLVLDPTRDYQPRGVKCGNSPENKP